MVLVILLSKIENTCVHFQIDHVEVTEKPVAVLAPIVAALVVNQFNLFNPDNSFHGFLNNTSSVRFKLPMEGREMHQ